MAIDLFGHGATILPVPNEGRFSHGPDPQNGPPCCRDVAPNCSGKCNDHSCCCDPCRHKHIELCDGHCCRCIPISLCATFVPSPAYENTKCRVRSWKLIPNTEGRQSTYQFDAGSHQIQLIVGEPVYGSPLYGQAACTWRLLAPSLYVDEEVEIGHRQDQVHCLAPPDFTITAINLPYTDGYGAQQDCIGDITFSEFALDKLPFTNRWHDWEETQPLGTACGVCDRVCHVLSVRRGTEDDYDYQSATCDEFLWNGTDGWTISDGDSYPPEQIELVQLYGDCYLRLTNWNTPTLDGDLILIDPAACSLGLSVTAKDELGNWIKISCSPCSCWKYVCGTCRCTCDTLCVIGFENGELQGPFELPWDKDVFRWGDEYTAGPVIQLNSDADDNCQVSMAGFADPVAIPNECGTGISFIFSDDIQTQLAYGIRMYAGWCKACEGSCNSGTCLSACDDVPKILYAHLFPGDWNPALGCGTYGGYGCFEPFVIPIAQLFVPSVLNPAGEWRWMGAQSFSCTGCDTGGNPHFETPRTNIAAIDIGCDGLGSLTITGDADGGGIYAFRIDINFELPCGGYATWNLGPWEDRNSSPLICCAEAGFRLYISDSEDSY